MSMDGTTKRRLLLGFLSNWIGKLAGTVIQLIQIPVFLHFWITPLYGEWMIVTSIPNYLSFTGNGGFGTGRGQRDDHDGRARGSRKRLKSVSFRAAGGSFPIILTVATIALLSGSTLLACSLRACSRDHPYLQHRYSSGSFFILGSRSCLVSLSNFLQSAYRSVGRYPFGSFLKTLFSLAAFASTIVAVILGCGPRIAALVFAVTNIVCTVILCLMVHRDIPWIKFGWSHASFVEIRKLARPAIAYMGFPLGNALSLQGSLLAVGYALGPVAVVVFSVARTVSRVALQMVQMVNNTFEPEMSLAYGSGNYQLTRTLLRLRALRQLGALVVAVIIVITMMTFGPWSLTHWTSGHVPPSRPLLSILLLVVVLYARRVHQRHVDSRAINQHQRLATYYIIGTRSHLRVLLLFCSVPGDFYGAAASLLIFRDRDESIRGSGIPPCRSRHPCRRFSPRCSNTPTLPAAFRPAGSNPSV